MYTLAVWELAAQRKRLLSSLAFLQLKKTACLSPSSSNPTHLSDYRCLLFVV